VLTSNDNDIGFSSLSFDAGSGDLMSAMCSVAPSPTKFSSLGFSVVPIDTAAKKSPNLVDGLAKSVFDTLVPTAIAQQDDTERYNATAVLDSGTNYVVTVQNETRGSQWSGIIPLGGLSKLPFDIINSCGRRQGSLSVLILNNVSIKSESADAFVGSIRLNVDRLGIRETLEASNFQPLPSLMCPE
jgi:hypothetical protein